MTSRKFTLVSWARFGALILACTCLVSCGFLSTQLSQNHRPYRAGENSNLIRATDPADPGNSVPVGVIEFDDQGEMWPDSKDQYRQIGGGMQLQRVIADIKQRARRKPVHVIVFVHGWNNSADAANERNGNLASFKQSLLQMRGFSDCDLYGVYVSWRGQVLASPIGVDYYNRDAAASRIGRTQATAALQAVCSAAYVNERSRVTAIGHSMGAVVLLRAVGPPLISDMVKECVAGNRVATRPMADTLILVNPADNAIYHREMAGIMKDFGAVYERPGTRERLPAIISITSDGDWATNYVFSFGAMLARYPLSSLMPHAGGATRSNTQEWATVRSIGFYPAIHSHALVDSSGERVGTRLTKLTSSTRATQAELIAANYADQFTEKGEIKVRLEKDGVMRDFVIAERPGALGNTTPFWMMRVPRFVVADHTDIWTANFAGLVTAIDCASRPARGKSGGPPPTGRRSERPFIRTVAPTTPTQQPARS